MNDITSLLFAEQDIAYGDFSQKLNPDIPRERVIGVRTPALRSIAKQLKHNQQVEAFLSALPHYYLEENTLQAFLIADIRDFSLCIYYTERFLPYIDNWATCDQFSPKVFAKHTEALLPYIRRWMCSQHAYTVRFGIAMLMRHFLKDNFILEYALMVVNVKSEHYYVRMMQAWYFATALVWQWDSVLPLLSCLDDWTRRKALQKARESYRITAAQKACLAALRP